MIRRGKPSGNRNSPFPSKDQAEGRWGKCVRRGVGEGLDGAHGIEAVEGGGGVSGTDVHFVAGAHFEMEVSRVVAVRGADGGDFPAAGDEGAGFHVDAVEMGIHRVECLPVRRAVSDDDDFPKDIIREAGDSIISDIFFSILLAIPRLLIRFIKNIF